MERSCRPRNRQLCAQQWRSLRRETCGEIGDLAGARAVRASGGGEVVAFLRGFCSVLAPRSLALSLSLSLSLTLVEGLGWLWEQGGRVAALKGNLGPLFGSARILVRTFSGKRITYA